ncbi:MAG: methylmalonyl-CoA epimerase [Acidobacteriota bacterium]
MTIKRISHIAIATKSIAVTAEFYKTLGLELDSMETIRDDKVKVAIMNVGDSALELVEPTQPGSSISGFLERRNEGLHHLSFEVDNIDECLKLLKERNIRLIDEKPRLGAEGRLIAFIHPESTGGVLVELSQPAAGGAK